MSSRCEGLLPGTRFAVDAYVRFVREKSLLEAIASSLTEMFSPDIISQRVSGMLRNYDFVTRETLAYFTPRLTQAPQDVAFALSYVKEHADTAEQQEQVLAALRFKCDLLWAQLDALHFAYVAPGPAAARRLRAPRLTRECMTPLRTGSAVVMAPEWMFLADGTAQEMQRLVVVSRDARGNARPRRGRRCSSRRPRRSSACRRRPACHRGTRPWCAPGTPRAGR